MRDGELTGGELVNHGIYIHDGVSDCGGDVVLKKDLVVTGTMFIAEGATLTVPDGITLTVAEGGTLDNDGVIANRGTIDNKGKLLNGAVVTPASLAARDAAANGTIDTRGGILAGSGTITNDGLVIVPSGTDIKALGMTGSGKVQMDGELYDNDGSKLGPAPDPDPTPRTSSGACDAGAGMLAILALAAVATKRRGR